MTQKSKLLLGGSLFVGTLLVSAISVASVYIKQKNDDYQERLDKLNTTKSPVEENPVTPMELPNEKVNSLTVDESSFKLELKSLENEYKTVRIELTSVKTRESIKDNKDFEVVDGKAKIEVYGLSSNTEYTYKVNGIRENKTEKTLFDHRFLTAAGAYFNFKASQIKQNDVTLMISGMEKYAGQIRPQFSIKYKIKDTDDSVQTLEEKNIDKQLMLGEKDYSIRLENLSAGRTYSFVFASGGKEIVSGEFTTLALVTAKS